MAAADRSTAGPCSRTHTGAFAGKKAWASCVEVHKSFPLLSLRDFLFSQEGEEACVGPTASSLLGSPAPSLGQLLAPPPEDVESVESLRHRLKADWKLLQITGECMTAASDMSMTHDLNSSGFLKTDFLSPEYSTRNWRR